MCRDEAAKKCNVANHCLFLESPTDEVVFQDSDTVLSSRMYLKKVSLEYNATCIEDDEDEDFEILY